MAGGAAEKTQSYTPIHCIRSDGMDYDYGPGLDDKTNTKPCEDPAIDARWRIHLGGYLKRELATGKDVEKDYILDKLPRGYVLRLTNANSDKKDYAIFGHPYGKNCRFRTSGEFAVHLMWLCSNSADWDDCSCDWCAKLVETMRQKQGLVVTGGTAQPTAARSPAAAFTHGSPALKQSAQAPIQNTQAPTRGSPAPGPGIQITPVPVPNVPVPMQNPPAPIHKSTPPAQNPPAPAQSAPAPARSTPPTTQNVPTPAQRATPPASVVPPGTTGPCNVFRISEMVWYKLNAAWRLGVIVGISAKDGAKANGDDAGYAFQLTPLGHALLQQPLQAKTADEMRPFLTFSVPDQTLPELKDKSFTEIDWPTFVTQWPQDPVPEKANHRKQFVGLEASKMAAKCVNNAFSTFNKVGQNTTVNGAVETKFGGVFFGAEMVHVGDPVRVTAGDGLGAVMRVAEIIVTESSTGATLQLRGSVYRLNLAPQGQQQAFTVQPEQLGLPFTEEVRIRDRIEGENGASWGWVLLEQDVVRAEHEVQGRFYVTHRLMRILAPEQLQQAIEKRSLGDQQQSLNNRGHSNGAMWMGRQTSRRATFGVSVGCQIVLPAGIVEL